MNCWETNKGKKADDLDNLKTVDINSNNWLSDSLKDTVKEEGAEI